MCPAAAFSLLARCRFKGVGASTVFAPSISTGLPSWRPRALPKKSGARLLISRWGECSFASFRCRACWYHVLAAIIRATAALLSVILVTVRRFSFGGRCAGKELSACLLHGSWRICRPAPYKRHAGQGTCKTQGVMYLFSGALWPCRQSWQARRCPHRPPWLGHALHGQAAQCEVTSGKLRHLPGMAFRGIPKGGLIPKGG